MDDIPLFTSKLKSILVLSGGGIKGICTLGAISKLKELEIIKYPEIYCGTSVGSIISFLLLIGYSPKDILDLLIEIDFTKLFQVDLDDIFENPHIGLSHTTGFMIVLKSFIEKRGLSLTITFKELYELFPSKLIITGTCVNDISLHYFSVDTTPSMPVVKAIEISICIPLLFKPIEYDGKIWIDGGCLNNYPIEIFHENLDDVIGIYLGGGVCNYSQFDNPEIYFRQVMSCVIRGMNINKINFYEKQTILIKDNLNVSWDLSKEDKISLYNIGYNYLLAQGK